MAENRIKRDRNWIREVTLENIGPFGGAREFEFREGLNIVTGPGGSGKTRLLRHILGAWMGNLPADSGMERDFRVGLETECGDAELADSGEGWARIRTWSRPEGWDTDALLFVDEDSLDRLAPRRPEESRGEHTMAALRALCADKEGPEIVLLDDIVTWLDRDALKEISRMLGTAGRQVILTEKMSGGHAGRLIPALEGSGKENIQFIRLEQDAETGTRVAGKLGETETRRACPGYGRSVGRCWRCGSPFSMKETIHCDRVNGRHFCECCVGVLIWESDGDRIIPEGSAERGSSGTKKERQKVKR